jgi:hypothetical protein
VLARLSVRASDRLDCAHDLMSEYSRRGCDLHLAVQQVQVGAADSARMHAQQQLALARAWNRQLARLQRHPYLLEGHRAHRRWAGRMRHS